MSKYVVKESLRKGPAFIYVGYKTCTIYSILAIMIQERRRSLLLALFIILASSLIAQQASLEPSTHKKKKPFFDPAPTHVVNWYLEWNGQYGGSSNFINYTHFGIHFLGDIRNRNALHGGAGYFFNPHLYVGGGTGIEYQDRGYSDDNGFDPNNYVGALWVVPVYAEVRGYLLNKPTTPFLQLRAGYAASIYAGEKRHYSRNSSYNNLSVGVRIRNLVSVTVGYLFMYQNGYLIGYDRFDNYRPLIGGPAYQHYATIGFTVNLDKNTKKP
ncbi:MAG: hypothetical protein JWO03_3772 [Bacteroidetes bacterium]|nr:hypothetical protein [Bacteroidota bacterium]